MWGYQHSFQRSAQREAKNIFSQLASNLEPHVFLVGVLNEKRDDCHPICLNLKTVVICLSNLQT
ncbi:hypothetical protein [Nostoc sp. C057]|uniref:hypothetical protein n=1 Tax=Nostoc sp. C057 TaxID=2576903 RepID=UPI0035622C84